MPVVARTRLMAEVVGSAGWQAPFLGHVDLAGVEGQASQCTVADGLTNQALTFPSGLTTITTLWLTSNVAVSVTLGATASNQARALAAGGLLGFANGTLAVAAGVFVTNASGATADIYMLVAGD